MPATLNDLRYQYYATALGIPLTQALTMSLNDLEYKAIMDGALTGGGSGGAPTGPAGGSLSGTYPNPSLNGPVATSQLTQFTNLTQGVVPASGGSGFLRADGTWTNPSTSGAAGGSLAGTYPNPTLAANSVGSNEIQNQSVTGTDIANNTVADGNLVNVATNTLRGRISAGTGSQENLTPTQVTSMLDTVSPTAKGLAPTLPNNTTSFLRGDGTYAVPNYPATPVASAITSTPVGNVQSTNVQAAIQELDTEKVNLLQPYISISEKYAGMYVPKRALDRWQQASKPWVTSVVGAMTNNQTTMTVSSIDGLPAPTTNGRMLVQVDTEQMFVTAGWGTTSWTIVRAVNNSTAATHAAGALVLGDAVTRVIIAGDSTAESSIGGGGGTAGGASGGDGWVTRLSRILSKISGLPLLSPQLGTGGFFGVWRNSDTNLGGGAGNSATDWSVISGTWTLVAAGVVNDRAPWGWTVTANGSTNILKLTVPPYMGSIRALDVYMMEGGTGLVGCSYDINNSGTWVNLGGTGVQVNNIHRFRVTSASDILDFRIRAATSSGTAINTRLVGVDLWPTAPTFGVTTGLKVYNLGKDSDFLSTFMRTNASGDNLAFYDGDPGSIYPTLCIIGPFTNDILNGQGGPYTLWKNNLTAMVQRVKPYCDVILTHFSEQGGSRAPSDQATMRTRLHEVASEQTVAYLDMYDAMSLGQGITGWAAADTEGYHGTIHDVNHYGPLGHQEMASRFDRLLTTF